MIFLRRNLVLVILLVVSLSGCSFPFFGGDKLTALEVTSTIKATVLMDGEAVGSTPFYSEKLKAGEYSIQLKPEEGTVNPWEARIKLTPGIKTVISRELGDSFDHSSGYVLSLEPMSGKPEETSLLIVTTPDGSLVSVDGEPKGFAPAAIENLSASDHVVIVSSPGYIEKSFNTNIALGYKLTASVQLAKSLQTEANQSKSKSAEKDADKDKKTDQSDEKALDAELDIGTEATPASDLKEADDETEAVVKPPYVIIKDTPTGWLNVREKPSTSSTIITKVNPGEKYPYLQENTTNWYQIELKNGKDGWVSGKYVELVEE